MVDTEHQMKGGDGDEVHSVAPNRPGHLDPGTEDTADDAARGTEGGGGDQRGPLR